MLGRRILTRMTRMGLAMYATLWCMSFTVCAYDDPIADMAVGGKTALLSEAAEDALPGEELSQPGDNAALTEEDAEIVEAPAAEDAEAPDEADPAEASDEEDALIDDDVEGGEDLDEEIEEIADEDSNSSIMAAGETGICFNVTSLTIEELDYGEFPLKVLGQGEIGGIAAENLTLTLEGVPEAMQRYISISKGSSGYFDLNVGYGVEGGKYIPFKINATYVDGENEYSAAINVVIYIPCYSIHVEAFTPDGSGWWDYENPTIRNFNTSNSLIVDVGSTECPFNISRTTLEIWDMVTDTQLYPGDTSPDYITFTENPVTSVSHSSLARNLSFGKDFDGHKLELRAIHNNDYVDADGQLIERTAYVAKMTLIPRYFAPVESITLNSQDMTVTDISLNYTLQAMGDDGTVPLDPDFLSYWISPTPDLTNLTDEYCGVRIYSPGYYYYERDYGFRFDSDYSWVDANEFYVVARYNRTEPALFDSYKVKVASPATSLYMYGRCSDGWYDLATENATIRSHNQLEVTLQDENYEAIDGSQVHLKIYEIFGEEKEEISPEARGISFNPTFSPVSRTPVWNVFNMSFVGGFEPGDFEVEVTYDNEFKDISGTTVTSESITQTFNVSVTKGYAVDVKTLHFDKDIVPITESLDPTEVELVLEGGIAGNATTNRTIEFEDLDPNRMRWGFTEPGSDQFLIYSGNTYQINGDTAKLTIMGTLGDYEVDFVAMYYNKGDYYYNASAVPVVARAHIVSRREIPSVEAHLSETSVKVQVYNGKNYVPVTIRTTNVNESRYLKYNMLDTVRLTNEELNNYVTAEVSEDGKSINFKAKELSSSEITALLKKSFTTGVEVRANVYGNDLTLNTSENLTITFGNTKLATKDVKVAETLQFDSFYSEMETKQINFTGAEVKEIVPIDAAALSKLGFEVVEGTTNITSNANIPKTKSGSFKVQAVLADSEINNLPENYNVTVTVKYKVINSVPKITLDKKTLTLNPVTRDSESIVFTFSGTYTPASTGIRTKVLDANNNPVDGALLVFKSYYGGYQGTIFVNTTSSTEVGKTYKLQVMPYNYGNDKEGAVQVVTIKTVTQANAEKTNITVKATGGINVYNPSQNLTLTFTGKNLDMFGKYPAYIGMELKNGTDVKEYFDVSKYTSNTSTLTVAPYLRDKDFVLYDAGLAGETVTIKVGFKLGEGSDLTYATYDAKIAATKVTPKLELTKVTINPAHGDTIDGSKVVCIPISNLGNRHFDYTIEFDCGNGITPPFDNSTGYAYGKDIINIYTILAGISSMYGKTCTVKITPVVPGGNAGTAVCKITVLNPAKSKITASAKAKGSIDTVKYGQNVTVTLSYKNTYVHELTNRRTYVTNITKKENGKEVDYINYFYTASIRETDTVNISRRSESNLAAGTYKAYLSTRIYDGSGTYAYINTTVNIKVVRSKTQTTVTPSPVKLINRDYARSATVYIAPKAAGVTGIREVKITGAYADYMAITPSGKGVYTLTFRDGYVEKSKIKQLWEAITKNVTKSVTMEVYYVGSTTPDKVTAKVKINP